MRSLRLDIIWLVSFLMLTTIRGDYNDKICEPCPYFVHPEVTYCVSDIVAKAKMVQTFTDPAKSTNMYNITTVEIIKLKSTESVALDFSYGVNQNNPTIMKDICYNFNSKHPDAIGKTYLLMGNIWFDEKGHPQIVLNQCSYAVAVKDINCYQRKGFKGAYGSNCACVNVGYNGNMANLKCPEMKKSGSCYNDYAYCKDLKTHCGWQQFWKFRDCL